jgi:3-hydroxybutyryl-CoA dehydrogenase
MFERVAVVGAGLMGRGIGMEYALAGSQVALFNSTAMSGQRALERARVDLSWLIDMGAIEPAAAESAAARLRVASDLADAVSETDLIVESLPEKLDSKRELFSALDALAPPSAILASNTSTFPITRLAESLSHPHRVIGTHYLNPPFLMPPVEVIPGEKTSNETVLRVEEKLRAMGKAPLLVRREVPGFIWNRLQAALLREALWLVESGVARPEDVDLAMSKGLGRRYSLIGFFNAVDLGGIPTWLAVARGLFPEISAQSEPGPLLPSLLAQGRTGAESGAGIYDWPPERLSAVRGRRDRLLIEWLERDRQESIG